MQSLTVAIAFFIAGKLGLMLAIPPGYATAIWPPAGIALAGVVLWGRRAWAGIFLGSALVNLATSAHLQDRFTLTLVTTFAIASGTLIQAAWGGYLSRRWLGQDFQFHEERGAFKFVLIAIISSLVSCSTGVGTLWVAGLIPLSNAPYSWFTWWIGDSVGAVLVAPVLIFVLQRHSPQNNRRRLQIIAPFSVVLACAIGIYLLARGWEFDRLNQEFESNAEEITDSLRRNLELSGHDLKSMESFFRSSQNVSQSEFRTFAKDVLAHDRFRAVGWSKYQTNQAPAAARAPLFYIEPWEEFRDSRGYDLLAEPDRRDTLLEARDTGHLALTPALTPKFDTATEPIVVLVQPVYAEGKASATVEERRKNIQGFIIGSLRLRHLMDISFAEHRMEGISLSVEDVSPSGTHEIFRRTSEAAVSYEREKKGMDSELASTHDLKIAGKTWRLSFSTTQEYLVGRRGWPAWLVLLFGMAFTSIFGLFLLVVMGRHSYVETLVQKRTDELSSLNRKMFAMAKMTSLGEMAGGVAHEINTPLAVIHMQAEMLKYLAEAGQCGPKEIIAGAENIERTVFRISSITKGLLSFAREGELDGTEETPLAKILKDTLSMCEARFLNHGVHLHINGVEEEFKVNCRAPQITQILLNLLNNAFDATRAVPDAHVHLDIKKEKGDVLITVSDNGHGIPDEIRERIFEPFFTTKGIGSGVGLGLSISAGIAVSHGGSLTLSPDRRTTFVLKLPLVSRSEELPA